MATFYDALTDSQQAWIVQQKIYFVASAPDAGRVNLSPKGMDSFTILGPNRVAYLDLTGSANETSAHLRQNGRITVMFCAFEGGPRIVRLFGQGRVVTRHDTDWPQFAPLFPDFPGTRQIIVINVDKTQDSCGMTVPLYRFEAQRNQLVDHWDKLGPDGVKDYWTKKNTVSMDGLEAVPLTDSDAD
ncbi:pyridoxamine 5'-phosphate oxidase family protein [Magnetovibrio blakemorei]|uniref:Pyridoxamine 5'-phosphate oxidase n=1 Tax=Magnetovibrio blakemorei TaxID=28181 RepID=A0A1E5Q3P7_9PROT|nr:pyridoxamine 5'-phosphate oxidase family protein [Magnetovibrio blakemorei]OEJ64339.1 pyridoxamine 5'-phosphate oxidase [Magnetovibrio blakemorei]